MNETFRPRLQTHVIFPHLAVSNSDEYFPEPERFLPERWIKRGELSAYHLKLKLKRKSRYRHLIRIVSI